MDRGSQRQNRPKIGQKSAKIGQNRLFHDQKWPKIGPAGPGGVFYLDGVFYLEFGGLSAPGGCFIWGLFYLVWWLYLGGLLFLASASLLVGRNPAPGIQHRTGKGQKGGKSDGNQGKSSELEEIVGNIDENREKSSRA